MKKILVSSLLFVLFLPFPAVAQFAQGKDSPIHFSAGVAAGTTGFGIEAACTLADRFVFRAGYADSFGMSVYSRTEQIDTDSPWVIHGPVTATASLHTGNISLVADVFPFRKSGIHFSLGAYCFLNPNGIARVATNEPLPIPQREWATTGIRIEHSDAPDEYITTDPGGFLAADLRMGTRGGGIKPYVGLGFGRASGDRPLNVTFDLGVVYAGSLNVYGYDYINARNGKPADARLTSGITDGYDKGIIDRLAGVPVYPVVRLGLNVKLF